MKIWGRVEVKLRMLLDLYARERLVIRFCSTDGPHVLFA
jgi:hypothetical protein